MPIYEYEGVRPVVDPNAFVHPTAVVIGDVIIEAVQAAGFSNNKEFGDYAISLMEIHNPGAVSLAKGFLESALNQSNK